MYLGFLSCEIAIRRFNHNVKFKKLQNGKGNQEKNEKNWNIKRKIK
jgi:hypothetical protein